MELDTTTSRGKVYEWDAIIITAASPLQSQLYHRHLARLKERGTICDHCIILAVPDWKGKRIGSGGATLGAVRSLGEVYLSPMNESGNVSLSTSVDILKEKKVLLVHAGGDSKRVPWANPMGKAFLPAPPPDNAQTVDPDSVSPTLMDRILDIADPIPAAMAATGGLLIMTGDVLPIFEASRMPLPADGTVVVTCPVTTDVASRHGVIIADSDPCGLPLVKALLQKPSLQSMVGSGAIAGDGTALLDTGIFILRGAAWENVARLATLEESPAVQLADSGQEMSLYEDMAGAWVQAEHSRVLNSALGALLLAHLGCDRLHHYRADDLTFLHFGTSTEVLNHLKLPGGFRKLSLYDVGRVAQSAAVLGSELSSQVSVGEGALVLDCSLGGDGVRGRVGLNSVVVHLALPQGSLCQAVIVPNDSCLWEVPLLDGRFLFFCCGVFDNPKDRWQAGGTFCGQDWSIWMQDRGIDAEVLWPAGTDRSLWHAKLFPAVSDVADGLATAHWLLGVSASQAAEQSRIESMAALSQWLAGERFSFSEAHRMINFQAMADSMERRQAEIALQLMQRDVFGGAMSRNLHSLSLLALRSPSSSHRMAAMAQHLQSQIAAGNSARRLVPRSRLYQALLDLSPAADSSSRAEWESAVWRSIQQETAMAVSSPRDSVLQHVPDGALASLPLGHTVEVRLPVRVDIAGGWSDTPPWSLERRGRVLNFAVMLEGQSPVGASITVTSSPGCALLDDQGRRCEVPVGGLDPIPEPLTPSDPFCLAKASLLVTGWALPGSHHFEERGIEVRTWARVPRGSGLGTSSILAGALVWSLLKLRQLDPVTPEQVSSLVLLVEQRMGTGGGWQDQVGGLYPGVKCSSSFPVQPLRLQVDRVPLLPACVAALHGQLLLVFTGQVRLARDVLHKVVRGYLRRDAEFLSTVDQLMALAETGRQALAMADFGRLGQVLTKTWALHHMLDPHCTNEGVEAIFRSVRKWSLGYKLLGAGGGGFGIVVAKSIDDATIIRNVLDNYGHPVKVFDWQLCEEEHGH